MRNVDLLPSKESTKNGVYSGLIIPVKDKTAFTLIVNSSVFILEIKYYLPKFLKPRSG
jgi:hypothetical protein